MVRGFCKLLLEPVKEYCIVHISIRFNISIVWYAKIMETSPLFLEPSNWGLNSKLIPSSSLQFCPETFIFIFFFIIIICEAQYPHQKKNQRKV